MQDKEGSVAVVMFFKEFEIMSLNSKKNEICEKVEGLDPNRDKIKTHCLSS